MKRIIIVLIGVIISLSGITQEIAFHGKISGIDSAQIGVVVLPLKLGETPISDITHCVRGKFDFRVKLNLNMWHLVRLNCEEFNTVFGSEKSGSQELKNREILFFIQPDDHVSVLAHVGAYGLFYQISGNKIGDQSSEVNKNVFPLEEEYNRLTILRDRAERQNEHQKAKELSGQLNSVIDQLSRMELATIAQHPDWIYSAELLAGFPNDTIAKHFKNLTPKVRNSFFGIHLSKILNAAETGSPAPP